MTANFDNHPCFNDEARNRFGRIHLPVAPKCNIQCNFCDRKHDCANESRPGVTSAILSPGQALAYLEEFLTRKPETSVVGIAGPGDPFANPAETLETLTRVRAKYPEMLLCVASNGLDVLPYVEEIAGLNISHLTITANALDPAVAGKIYRWVRDGKRVLRGEAAGALLIERQWQAIAALKERGVTVKINCILMPGINTDEVLKVASRATEYEVDILNILPLIPVEGTPFATLESPAQEDVLALREQASQYVPQMTHCARCRADAAGLLGEQDTCGGQSIQIRNYAKLPIEPTQHRPYVAVASMEGALVNQHLGEARKLWICEPQSDGYVLVDTVEAPLPGDGSQRWERLAEQLGQCRLLLTSGAGSSPKQVLSQHGIDVQITQGVIELLMQQVHAGLPLPPPRGEHACGVGCTGNGNGCG